MALLHTCIQCACSQPEKKKKKKSLIPGAPVTALMLLLLPNELPGAEQYPRRGPVEWSEGVKIRKLAMKVLCSYVWLNRTQGPHRRQTFCLKGTCFHSPPPHKHACLEGQVQEERDSEAKCGYRKVGGAERLRMGRVS